MSTTTVGSVRYVARINLEELNDDADRLVKKVKKTGKQVRKSADKSFSYYASQAANSFSSASKALLASGLIGGLASLASTAAAASGAVLTLPAAAAAAAGVFATLKTALVGVGDAMSAIVSGDAKKLNEAMQNLSGNAKEFVRAFSDVKDAFEPVRKAVQDALFLDLGKHMKQVAENAMPTLKTGLVDIANSINGLLKAAGKTIQSDFFNGALADTLKLTADTVDILKGAIEPLIGTIFGLVKAGAPFIKQLAHYITDNLKAAAAFLKTKDGIEAVRDVIKTSLKALGQIIDLFQALGRALFALFEAGAKDGKTFITVITDMLNKFADFAGTAEGGRQLATVLNTLTLVSQATLIAISDLAKVLGKILMLFSKLPDAVQSSIITFLVFSSLISSIGLKIAALVKGVGYLIGALSKAGGWVLRIGKWFLALGGPIRLVIGIVAAVTAGLIWFFTQTKVGSRIAQEYMEDWKRSFVTWKNIALSSYHAVISGARHTWNGIKSAFSGAVDFFYGLWSRISGAFTRIGINIGWAFSSTIRSALNSAVQFIEDKVNHIIWLINNVLNTIDNITPGGLPRLPYVYFPGFADGGFTGRGGKHDMAGIVHAGEYVVPKEFVNQSTGLPEVTNNETNNSNITINVSGTFATSPQEQREVANLIARRLQEVQQARGMA